MRILGVEGVRNLDVEKDEGLKKGEMILLGFQEKNRLHKLQNSLMKVMLNKQVVDKELEWIQFLVAFKLVTDMFAVFLDDILLLRKNSLELLELQILSSVHKLALVLVRNQTYSFMELRKEQRAAPRKEQKMRVHKKQKVGLQMEQMMVQGKEKEN